MKYCIDCGNELKENEEVCSKCGAKTGLVNKKNIDLKKKSRKKLITALIIIIIIALIAGSIISYFIVSGSKNKLILYEKITFTNEKQLDEESRNSDKEYIIPCSNINCHMVVREDYDIYPDRYIPINDGNDFFIYDITNSKKVYKEKENYSSFVNKGEYLILQDDNKSSLYIPSSGKIIKLKGYVPTAANAYRNPSDSIIIYSNDNRLSAIDITTGENVLTDMENIYCDNNRYCIVTNNDISKVFDFTEKKYILDDYCDYNAIASADGYSIFEKDNTYFIVDLDGKIIEEYHKEENYSYTGSELTYFDNNIYMTFISNDKNDYGCYKYKFNTKTKESIVDLNGCNVCC